ncbi:MAG: hypothetical protein FWG99_11205 [Treponema sp.]|nr:hypothetical protein [Treponema sp.]
MKNAFFALLGGALLGALVMFPLGSCSTGGDAAAAASQLFGGSSQAPMFIDCKAVSETEIDFQFSVPVKVMSVGFSPELEIDSVEDGSTVRVSLAKKLGVSVRLVAELLAEDAHGNTINVLVPFRSKNTRVPGLIINELRTEYSKPRAEFIEFKILSDGNLGALRVFAASNNKNPMVYEFLPVEVRKGDYVVLHMRTLEDDCIDEYGSVLDESGGNDSSPTARDFWIPGSTKLLRKTDAVYVLDQDDRALAAVMLSENRDSQWQREHFQEAAEFLFAQGAWKSPDGNVCMPVDAVDSYNIRTSATRSISRDEITTNTKTAADWYVTANSGATPGRQNNPSRF